MHRTKRTLAAVIFCLVTGIAGHNPVSLLFPEAPSVDAAIRSASAEIAQRLGEGTRVAVVAGKTGSARLADYLVDTVAERLLSAGNLVLVERNDLDTVRDELQFQASGDVSDESAQSIGKMLGAQAIVTVYVDQSQVLRMKAVQVETARILALASARIALPSELATLSADTVRVLPFQAAAPDRTVAETLTGLVMSAVSEVPGWNALDSAQTGHSATLSARLSRAQGLLWLTLTLTDEATGAVRSSVTGSFRSEGTLLEGARTLTLRLFGAGESGDGRKAIAVSNVSELLEAIGPDRIIRLAPGDYDLTKGYETRNRHITWVDEYDGPCPVVKSVSNLTLEGAGLATIMIKPAYGWVFSFETCTNVTLSGLTFGHTVPGYCLGGVLRFRNCDEIEIRSCDLYGSGTYGLGLERTSRFTMENSAIHDCTYGLAVIERSEDVFFSNTRFSDTGEFDLVEVIASEHLRWSNCSFERNWGNALFSVDAESSDLALDGCAFTDNETETFSARPEALSIAGASYEGNAFALPDSEAE